MNSAEKSKKKISEYTFEDIKKFFSENFKKISSKIILLEIGNGFLNIGVAKSQNNRLYIKKVIKQTLPKEALEKSLPSDPNSFGVFLNQIINENKIYTNRIALSLPSDTCYTRLVEIPEEVEENDAINFLENPNSDIQIPISLENSDFETPQSTAERAHRMSMALWSEETLSVSLGLGTIKATDTQSSAYGTQHRRKPGDATKQVLIQIGE